MLKHHAVVAAIITAVGGISAAILAALLTSPVVVNQVVDPDRTENPTRLAEREAEAGLRPKQEIDTENEESEGQKVARQQANVAVERAGAEHRDEPSVGLESLVIAAREPAQAGLSLGLAIAPAQPSDPLDQLAAVRITSLLEMTAPAQVLVVSPIFADRFYSEGYFAQAYEGDSAPLRETRSLGLVSHLILGKTSASCLPNPTNHEMVACDVSFAYKIFDNSGSAADANHLTERGPGFSDTRAVERGIELLIERHSAELFRIFER
jgi:hypothetical protein